MSKKSISQIEQATTVNPNDLLLISQYDGEGTFSSRSIQVSALYSQNENVSNKVTSLSSSSTDEQYPSAKCVYDLIGDIEAALIAINGTTNDESIE